MIEVQIIGLQAAVTALRALGPRLRQRVRAAMTRLTIDLATYVKQQKLSGQVLRNRTGNLRRSIKNMVTVQDDGHVTGFVGIFQGPTLRYGRAHEFGFDGTVQVREHTRRQTMVFGRPMVPIAVTVAAHMMQMHLPERSFLRTSLRENAGVIRERLQAAVAAALAAKGV